MMNFKSAFQDLKACFFSTSFQDHFKGVEYRINSVSVAFEGEGVLRFLKAQTILGRWFFRYRDQACSVAGLGVCRQFVGGQDAYDEGMRSIDEMISVSHPDVRVFGGHQFGTALEGEGDPYFRYDVPRFCVVSTDLESRLYCFFSDQDYERVCADFDLIIFDTPDLPDGVFCDAPISVQYLPMYAEWCQLVSQVQAGIERGEFEKIVLARQAMIETPFTGLDVVECALKLQYKGFFFWMDFGTHDFFGVSPELLFYRKGRDIYSEAIAGTGRLDDGDLLCRPKDRVEHRLVLDMIVDSLTPLCETVSQGEVSTIRGNMVQHLYAQVQGKLRDSVQDADVSRALHPTPAVCGFPKGPASRFLVTYEPVKRGFYSGAIGLFGQDSACMVVAIRSGVSRSGGMCLYSGAGILAESDATLEWEELNIKLAPFLDILSIQSIE